MGIESSFFDDSGTISGQEKVEYQTGKPTRNTAIPTYERIIGNGPHIGYLHRSRNPDLLCPLPKVSLPKVERKVEG